jgi:hypothetical protein
LKFVLHGEVHYGWARFNTVKATANPPTVRAFMTGYAFETRPNEPIQAGQTADVPSASLILPEGRTATYRQPAGLGVLALGSTGLDAWRRDASLED